MKNGTVPLATPLIETVGLRKYFETPKGLLHAVEDVNLRIMPGKTLGVVGESGCGKSTLGRLLMRLIDATSGQVLLNGSDILAFRGKKKNDLFLNMQMIFQDPYSSLNPRLSISQIIAEPLKVQKLVHGRRELRQRVLELMESVGLPARYENIYPHELDGGRRQRVGLTRALALDPKFIVCDEPVSALDVSIQAQILNLLMDLQEKRGLTYMFISHDMCVVRHISDNIMVMYMGQVVEYASKNELFANPLHPYTNALLSAIPTTDLSSRSKKRLTLKGEVANPVNPLPGCRFAPRCPHAKKECSSQEIPLKQVSENHHVSCLLV
jgi:peptide/nickel transport system ATP-binding protein